MGDVERYNSIGDALLQIRQIVQQSRKQIFGANAPGRRNINLKGNK
jgi:hypothetical protein